MMDGFGGSCEQQNQYARGDGQITDVGSAKGCSRFLNSSHGFGNMGSAIESSR